MPSHQPSKWSLRLIEWLCKEELVEELHGNLLEYYQLHQHSKFKRLKYWFQVVNYLRPSTLKSINRQNSGPMFIFNPILTFRNLYRQRSTSLISIFGFSLGLVATFFLYFYIYSEVTTDQFHTDKEKIYRLLRVSAINGTPYRIGVTSVPYKAAILNDYPDDITSAIRTVPESGLVTIGEKSFFEDEMLFADKEFFEFFSYPLKNGDPSSVLANANSAVLSTAAALKYFGDENPIGQTFKVDREYEFIVSGIMDELPTNSHLNFEMVLSIGILERFDWFDGWWNNSLFTYVHIPTDAQAEKVASSLDQFMDKYMGEDFERSGNRVGLELEPLEEIYFNNETRYDFASHGNLNGIVTLGIVAIAILFIACFNYVNLSIAQAFTRAKEVGVRKVLGGSRLRLIFQFLSESLTILLLSILLSIGICELVQSTFTTFFGLEIVLNWLDQNVLIFLLVLIAIVMLMAGVFPALLLASFKSVSILRGQKLTSGRNSGLRKGLVVTQFAISIFLIVSSILITFQTSYMDNKDLGFTKEAIVVVDLNNGDARSNRDQFKDRLKANSSVIGVTSMSGEPGGFHDASTFDITGLDVGHRLRTLFVDPDYFDVMDIEISAGRAFSREIASDENYSVILNEKAVAETGLTAEEIVGRKVTMPGWEIANVPIIGVASNFNFISLKEEIEPLAILCGGYHRRLAVKLQMADIGKELELIESIYEELVPGYPMSYEFLDDRLENLYEKERQQAKIFGTFSGLSIFLACLGIFGLAAYAAQKRQKELGIRKVLGATARQIIALISREFVTLVVIATFVAIPVAWYFIQNWLGAYAYRITLLDYWYVFLVGGIISVIIALITVTFKTYRAAVSDPTESIRTE